MRHIRLVLALILVPLTSTCTAATLSANQLYGSWRVSEVLCTGCSGPVLSLKNKIIQIKRGGVVNPAGDDCQAPPGFKFIKAIGSGELLAGPGGAWPSVVRDGVAARPKVLYGFLTCRGINYMQVLLISPDAVFYMVEEQEILVLKRAK